MDVPAKDAITTKWGTINNKDVPAADIMIMTKWATSSTFLLKISL